MKSRRSCCVCQAFQGRNVNVHHIVPEAEGGSSTIENAIVLCLNCHAEAGHYNPSHPLGTKYSRAELIRHRDEWWARCATHDREFRLSTGGQTSALSIDRGIVEKEVGIVWSHLANMPADSERVRFDGVLLARVRTEDANGPSWFELYGVGADRYVVSICIVHRGDWCSSTLVGADLDWDPPLSIGQVHDEYPALANAAGLQRIREIDFDARDSAV